MIINRIALPRRTVLRGIGASVTLPFLDAMVPAFAAKAATLPVKRFGVVYFPNGMILKNLVPATAGKDFAITPILRPLAQYRDQLTVVSGLSNKEADPFENGNGPHSRGSGTWLSGTRAVRAESAGLRAGRTADQFAADVLGKDTPLRSLELALEPNFTSGTCESGYSCTYLNTFTWAAPDRPLPMETNPAVVFERLFGDAGPGSARLAQMRRDKSILDLVTQDLGKLQRSVGPADRQTVEEYFDSVRDVERRIQQTSARGNDAAADFEKPHGIPPLFEEHAKLMFDLMFLAYQTDMTRVVSYQIAREISLRSYPEIGVVEAHHDISHHGNQPAKIAGKAKIDEFHMGLFAHLVGRMAATPDGDGSLLDHSILLAGGGFGDGDSHVPHNLPVVVVGSGGGLQAGRHVRAPFDAPFMNLCLSLLDRLDVHLERLGDSTGRLAEI